MIARLTWCFVFCGAVGAIFATDLHAQVPKTAAKAKETFEGSKAGEEWQSNSLKMRLCWCPPGKFMMGSPKSEPKRSDNEDQVEVTLSRGFWLGKFEVTQGQWEKVMGSTLGQQRDKADPTFKLYGESANFPMYYVNHDEALAFCRKLTEQERRAGRLLANWEFTLPTEAQWEYACRAGTKTATAFGDKLSSRQANFDGSELNYGPYNGADNGPYLGGTTTVGGYNANAWGLHDVHGNVMEWCRDWHRYSALPGGADPEVTKKGTYRMLRGGSWEDLGVGCRSAFRNYGKPDYRGSRIGFRVALVQSR
jgi:formylglycine-generating enzyme required for sulfatase activity